MPFLAAAGLISEPPTPAERERFAAATPLIQERINTLSEAVGLLAFLFLPDDKIAIADDAGLSTDSIPILKAAYEALAAGGLRSRLCRSGAANGSDRHSGPEATACLRPGAGRDHRQSDLTAAVRVDRAAGPRINAGADRCSAGGTGTAGVRRIRTRPRRCRTIEIVTKQKRSAGPARTPSKARSRSGNPAVRAGEAGPVATPRSLDPPQIASRRSRPRPSRPRRPPARRCRVSADPARRIVCVVALGGGRGFRHLAVCVGDHGREPGTRHGVLGDHAGNQPYRDYFAKAFAFETPLGMLAVNLGLATLIPIAWA